jgi:3-hydroxymyristoyl/3-hydroxydecanoyl-(acyl carrier protein) dehydratase
MVRSALFAPRLSPYDSPLVPSDANGKRRQVVFERAGEHTFRTTLSPDLLYFEGHFDGLPLLPAVAQLLRLVMPLVRLEHPDLGDVHKLRRARFRLPLEPGAAIAVTLSRALDRVSFEIIRLDPAADQEAASGTLQFHRRPGPGT